MKIVVSGSRGVNSLELVSKLIEENFHKTKVTLVTGNRTGVERLAHTWATKECVFVETLPTTYSRYGLSAGLKQNEDLAKTGESFLVLRFEDDFESEDLCEQVRLLDKPLAEIICKKNPEGVIYIIVERKFKMEKV